jgi:SAM-dependent methyltransferase
MLRIAANQDRDFRWRCLRDLLLPYLGPGDVLDAGCGSGHLTREALAGGARVTAVDLSLEMLETTRQTCAAFTARLQMRRLDVAGVEALQPARFDRALAIDVLEHVHDDAGTTRQLAGLLRPGGSLVVLVPAVPAFYGTRDRSEGHYRRYSAPRLKRMLEEAGLTVMRLRYWNLTSVPLVLLFEKLLRRNMYDDGTRYLGGSPFKRAANELLAAALGLERHIPAPIGLSLLAVAVRGRENTEAPIPLYPRTPQARLTSLPRNGEKGKPNDAPRADPFYQRLAQSYRVRYGSDFSRVFRDYWFEKLLEGTNPGPDKTVLDAGCGSGVILSALTGTFGPVLGLDKSFAMLSSVERATVGASGVLLGDMQAIPLPDACVDVAICRGSLCHVDDMPRAITELHRILKPGGVLVVSEPSMDSAVLRVPRVLITRRSKLFKKSHRAYYSGDFRRLFNRVGLRIFRDEYFGYLSFPLCGMSDVIPLIQRLPAKTVVAAGLVAVDRALVHVPLLKKQAWHIVLAGRKG